jgi:hypothetical protein
MSIFGISMLDIYGLSIFSAFFAEISYITSNARNIYLMFVYINILSFN